MAASPSPGPREPLSHIPAPLPDDLPHMAGTPELNQQDVDYLATNVDPRLRGAMQDAAELAKAVRREQRMASLKKWGRRLFIAVGGVGALCTLGYVANAILQRTPTPAPPDKKGTPTRSGQDILDQNRADLWELFAEDQEEVPQPDEPDPEPEPQPDEPDPKPDPQPDAKPKPKPKPKAVSQPVEQPQEEEDQGVEEKPQGDPTEPEPEPQPDDPEPDPEPEEPEEFDEVQRAKAIEVVQEWFGNKKLSANIDRHLRNWTLGHKMFGSDCLIYGYFKTASQDKKNPVATKTVTKEVPGHGGVPIRIPFFVPDISVSEAADFMRELQDAAPGIVIDAEFFQEVVQEANAGS